VNRRPFGEASLRSSAHASEQEADMRHHVVYWKMIRREVELDDVELDELRAAERRHEVYIEYLDGERLPLRWDVRTGRWDPERPTVHRAA
jgi:hypothetical protein